MRRLAFAALALALALIGSLAGAKDRSSEELSVARARRVAVVRVMAVMQKATKDSPAVVEIEVEEPLKGAGGRFEVDWRNAEKPRIGSVHIVTIDAGALRPVVPACCRYGYSEERKRSLLKTIAAVEASEALRAHAEREKAKIVRDRRETARAKADGPIYPHAEVIAVVRRADATTVDGKTAVDLGVLVVIKGDHAGRLLLLSPEDEKRWRLVAPFDEDRVLIFAEADGGYLKLVATGALLAPNDETVTAVRDAVKSARGH